MKYFINIYFEDLVAECTDDVVNHFLKQAENGEKINIEMKDFSSRYTTDVIATCAFGLKVNSFAQPENEFYLNGKSLLNFKGLKQMLTILLMYVLPAIARALNISLSVGPIAKFFHDKILDTIKIRKEKNNFRPDMINIMMQVREKTSKHQAEDKRKEQESFATVEESDVGKVSVNRNWNDDKIVAQYFVFFADGFDTTSTLLTFTSYELAVTPDIQQKLYEEIHEMEIQLDGKHINYDALQKMKYLDQVVCESLRKWPPATTNDRICVKEYVLNLNDQTKLKIEKGTSLLFSAYGIHHDPKYFPEPDKFDPERFSDQNKNSILMGTYIPFGIGPRTCIGMANFIKIKFGIFFFNSRF